MNADKKGFRDGIEDALLRYETESLALSLPDEKALAARIQETVARAGTSRRSAAAILLERPLPLAFAASCAVNVVAWFAAPDWCRAVAAALCL
jgi:hypothetical protein